MKSASGMIQDVSNRKLTTSANKLIRFFMKFQNIRIECGEGLLDIFVTTKCVIELFEPFQWFGNLTIDFYDFLKCFNVIG